MDWFAYLQVILLEDGSLHEVHVADGDGGKVDGVERRGERVHVGGDGVGEEVEDGPVMWENCFHFNFIKGAFTYDVCKSFIFMIFIVTPPPCPIVNYVN